LKINDSYNEQANNNLCNHGADKPAATESYTWPTLADKWALDCCYNYDSNLRFLADQNTTWSSEVCDERQLDIQARRSALRSIANIENVFKLGTSQSEMCQEWVPMVAIQFDSRHDAVIKFFLQPRWTSITHTCEG